MHVYLINDDKKIVSYFGSGSKAFRKADRAKKEDQAIWQSTIKYKIGDKV